MNKCIAINNSNDISNFYKNINKYIRYTLKHNIKFRISKNINKQEKSNINDIIKVLNIKDKKERIRLAYDIACDYIDKEFVSKNFCEFENNTCIVQRQLKKLNNKNGCCGNCKNLYNKHCSIKALSCKLYFCPSIKKKKTCIKLNDLKVLKYFFNWKQKIILKYSVFIDKEDLLKYVYKNSLLFWSFTKSKNR